MTTATSLLEIVVSMKDEASGALKGLKGSLENAGLASGIVAGALVGLGAAGFGAARAAEEAAAGQRQLNAVLESTKGVAGVTAEQVNGLAETLSKLTNYDDDAIVSGQNLLLTFTKIGKDVFPAATETMLDMSAALGQDLKASALQLGKALNDPIEGVNALRRVGVSFTQDQQDMIKSLVESGDLMGAQKLILAELNTEFGKSATAAADPWIQMNNALGEVNEAIGAELKPALDALAIQITAFAQDVLPKWIEKAKEIATWLKENESVIYIVAGAVVGALVPAIYAAVVAFGALAIALAPFIIGGAIIGGIVAGIVWIVKNWDMLSKKAHEIFDPLLAYLKGIWDGITNAITSAIATITKILDPFINSLERAVQLAKDVGSTIGGGGSKSKKVDDAVISPSGSIVSTNPRDWLIATQNPLGLGIGAGVGVTINLMGDFFTDSETANRFGDEIARQIKNQLILAGVRA